MRLSLLIVIVCVLACGAKPAATVLSGDVSSSACSPGVTCSPGGGQGSIAQETVVIGAAALGVAAAVYVFHLVHSPARSTILVR